MGFWDKAFKVAQDLGTTALNELEKNANHIRETRDKYENLPDSELLRIVKSDGFLGKSNQDRAIAFEILRKRGYSPEDLR